MTKTPTPREIGQTCIATALRRASRTVSRHYEEHLRPLDLTPGQFTLIASLKRPVPPSMVELAEQTGMDRTTLTAALKPLSRRGLVKLQADEEDSRRRTISLTGEGEQVFEQAVVAWQNAQDGALKALGDDADHLVLLLS